MHGFQSIVWFVKYIHQRCSDLNAWELIFNVDRNDLFKSKAMQFCCYEL